MKRDGVLVVDDDPDFRELVHAILEPMGVAVFDAPDCCAGIVVLQRERERLRVVLLDYLMPGMSPAECALEMRKQEGAEVSIVLVTAAMHPGSRAAELGLTHWLSKPFDIHQLVRLTGVVEK